MKRPEYFDLQNDNDLMAVIECPVCHNRVGLIMSWEQATDYYKNQKLAQTVFPTLDATTRDILITGMCTTCQIENEKLWGGDE